MQADINRIRNLSNAAQSSSKEAVVQVETRILVLAVSPDQSAAYVPLMNAIFSAQKLASLHS
jgi:transcription initiation factor TFIIH subunit 3